jgi:hypothetical protein
MDVRRNGEANETAAGLAEQARQASLHLYLRAAGLNGPGGIDNPAEICQVLGSLKSLVDNIVRSLPELGAWLEQQLLAGTLPEATDDVGFDALTMLMRDTTAALGRARNVGAQLGRDLELAQNASRGLIAPVNGG